MLRALTALWSDCKILVGVLGGIGFLLGVALLASSEASEDDYGMPKDPKNTPLKYLGLSILLISTGAVGYYLYTFYEKDCRKARYDWKAGNI